MIISLLLFAYQIKYLHVLVKGLLATMKMVDEGHVHVSTDSFTVAVPAQTLVIIITSHKSKENLIKNK